MLLLRYLLVHAPETKYLHYREILREDVNTIGKPFSDSHSKISASSIGCSFPYLSHRHWQMFFTKTIFKKWKKKFLYPELREHPRKSYPSSDTEVENVYMSEFTEKSNVVWQHWISSWRGLWPIPNLCTEIFIIFRTVSSSPCALLLGTKWDVKASPRASSQLI